MRPRAFVFDLGYTLVDEDRSWAWWASVLGVPPVAMLDAIRQVVREGKNHRAAFELLKPGFDMEAHRETQAREAGWEPRDLYPDALKCLVRLRAAGYVVGAAGNQPAWTEAAVKRLGLPVEFMASSAGMGIEKPDPEFFRRVAGLAGLAPDELVYVGDRVDNDVLPPLAIGMGAVLVRRGPWAEVQAEQGLHAHAPVIVDSLDQLPAAVEALDQPG